MSYERFKDVCKIIENWRPKNYRSEPRYQADLIKYLRSELNKENLLLTRKDHIVEKGTGPSKVDIDIDKEIGVELKYNLASKPKSEIRKLRDQVRDHLKYYEYVFVVLCGKTHMHQEKEIKSGLEDKIRSGVLFSSEKVKIFSKY